MSLLLAVKQFNETLQAIENQAIDFSVMHHLDRLKGVVEREWIHFKEENRRRMNLFGKMPCELTALSLTFLLPQKARGVGRVCKTWYGALCLMRGRSFLSDLQVI